MKCLILWCFSLLFFFFPEISFLKFAVVIVILYAFEGVVEYLSNGGVAENHKDFKELRYSECLTNFSCNGKSGKPDGSITHSFQLKSAYESNLMPYTNYTYDFKVKRHDVVHQGFPILVLEGQCLVHITCIIC